MSWSRMKRTIWPELRDRLRASLWPLPAAATVVAFLSAKLLVIVDARLEADREAWFLFAGQPESARELVSTIASAMMTFIGLVFSITILVLQLASSQFSPRVLQTFMKDRVTQTAMAAFVGTFVFALALLMEIRSGEGSETQFVPELSTYIAFALVILSVGVFIHYIDHMARSVQAVTIIKRVARETRRTVERMYPEVSRGVGEAEAALVQPARAPDTVLMHDGPGGVVSTVDEQTLMDIAEDAGCIIAVVPMPGDFVPCGGPLIQVWGEAPEQESALLASVRISEQRSEAQDPAFGFRQLVDIAERALSPGINDPSTAVQALDELHDILRLLAQRRFPSRLRQGSDGSLRLVLPRPDWNAFVLLALDEVRQYGSGSMQVVRRIRALLVDCISVADADKRRPLQHQLQLLDEAIDRSFESAADRDVARKPSTQGHGPH